MQKRKIRGRKIVLDTETTGRINDGPLLERDRVVEIGCLQLDGRWITKDEEDRFHVYINPEREMDQEVISVHHISNEFLADKPLFADIIDDFIEFIRDSELIIHNAQFDIGVLDGEFARCGKGKVEDYVDSVTDTLSIARKAFPGRTVSLDSLCTILEIDKEEREQKGHGALLDAELLAEVYLTMTRGQNQIKLGMGFEPDKWGPAPDNSILPVIKATAEELKEHERILDDVEKKCKGESAWRKFMREHNPEAPEKADASTTEF